MEKVNSFIHLENIQWLQLQSLFNQLIRGGNSPNLKNMKLTEEEYLDLQQATKLSKPTIYKALNEQEVLKVTEYVVKLAYLEMKEFGITKEWLNEKIFELDQMIENE